MYLKGKTHWPRVVVQEGVAMVSLGQELVAEEEQSPHLLVTTSPELDTCNINITIINSAANPWNNGKSGAKLVLTSSTTPGLQIHNTPRSN